MKLGILALGLIAAMPVTAAAQQLGLLFEEDLGGVYKQWWTGAVIGADPASGVLVFVRGDGKSGDFYGVLSVDCVTPEFSAWVAEGGVISTDAIPGPAIDAVRAEACGSP
ncbi:hypothetical protein [Pseudooctadecabacter sp.]|uniref:hypothetical protein n=1 Tax=Pseudooctadecabacter sp. TaxID=1966338 RepID=UPI0025FE7C09|nr:hypothetical protein [Pseudooctadecabacter sp.]